ncbi:hypothetical protein [Alkaliphilus metalliredigens]|nr:hypothetical protein [Alkaliphilus metalliredigens]
MALVCPICNGLASYVVKCDTCHQGMEARGAIQDYFDDYSPYLSQEITKKNDGVDSDQCVHLFYCPHCQNDTPVVINVLQM